MRTRARERTVLSFPRVIFRMLALTGRSAPGSFALYLSASIAFTGLLFANIHFIRIIVERLPLFANGAMSYREILSIVLLYGGANFLTGITNGACNFLYEYSLKRTSGRMAWLMHEKSQRIDLVSFETAGLFNDIDNAAGGRDRGFEAMEKVVFSIVFHGGYFLFLGLYLATVKWQLILALGASFLPGRVLALDPGLDVVPGHEQHRAFTSGAEALRGMPHGPPLCEGDAHTRRRRVPALPLRQVPGGVQPRDVERGSTRRPRGPGAEGAHPAGVPGSPRAPAPLPQGRYDRRRGFRGGVLHHDPVLQAF